ncbi:hypothetical protein ACTF0Z_18220, partial [Klebsiella pneumoniae]
QNGTVVNLRMSTRFCTKGDGFQFLAKFAILPQNANSQSFQGRAGSTNVAGLLQNEPGALFIQCSLFLFLLRICYPAPGF